MARCPDCNKFVSYDTDTEPEIEDVQVFDESTEVQGSVRVVLCCAECGTELKESNQEFNETFEHTCEMEDVLPEFLPEFNPKEDEQYEIEDSSATFHERYQDRNPKTGKPIKNPRYMKKYYGAEIVISIKCNKCGDTFDQEITTEEQASYFDEC